MNLMQQAKKPIDSIETSNIQSNFLHYVCLFPKSCRSRIRVKLFLFLDIRLSFPQIHVALFGQLVYSVKDRLKLLHPLYLFLQLDIRENSVVLRTIYGTNYVTVILTNIVSM